MAVGDRFEARALVSAAIFAVMSMGLISGCDADPSLGVSASRGSSIYLKQCASCHGADGASPMGGVPPLFGSEWVVGAPGPLTAILLDGLKGPGEGVMPAGGTFSMTSRWLT